ncbi:MAG TPA: hypothetical protein VFV08_05335, partial [Puia sp.]|nr:hypothetical protein [Puia sp.]
FDFTASGRFLLDFTLSTQPLRPLRTYSYQTKKLVSMKLLLRNFILLSSLVIWVASCSKDKSYNSGSTTTPTPAPLSLTLSGSSIQKGQPLVASLPAGTATSNIHWTVSPSSGAYISSSNGQAMIMFANPGQYQVTASFATDSLAQSSDSSTAPITVIDSVYQLPQVPPISSDTFSLAQDQINITPMFDTTGELVLLAKSAKSYGCFPTFVVTLPFNGVDMNGPGSINIGFAEVISTLPAGVTCNGAENPAAAYLFVKDWVYGTGNQKYPADGAYPISIWVAGQPYLGSLTIHNGTYDFSWNYNAGVVISPLEVKRP